MVASFLFYRSLLCIENLGVQNGSTLTILCIENLGFLNGSTVTILCIENVDV